MTLTGATTDGNTSGYVISGNSSINTYGDNHIGELAHTGTLTLVGDN